MKHTERAGDDCKQLEVRFIIFNSGFSFISPLSPLALKNARKFSKLLFYSLSQRALEVALRILKRTNDMVNVGMLQGFEVSECSVRQAARQVYL